MKNEPDNMPRNAADDSLDELLRSAKWPDDASDPLNRLLLMAEWPELVGNPLPDVRRIVRRKTRKKILAAVGAAAAVVFAAVAFRVAWHAGDSSAGGTRPPEAPQAELAVDDLSKTVSQLPSREVRLRMILEQIREKSAAEDETIDRIVALRIADPDGDLSELVQPLLARRAEFEQRILARFGTFIGERESVAVELLGCLGGETSLPLVLNERLKPSVHAVAVRAALALADSETLAQLERQEWDVNLQQQIKAVLRSRDDKQTTTSTQIFERGDQSCLMFPADSSSRSELF